MAMRNGAHTAGSMERAVGINPLPYEMQPGKITPESSPLLGVKRYRRKHPTCVC